MDLSCTCVQICGRFLIEAPQESGHAKGKLWISINNGIIDTTTVLLSWFKKQNKRKKKKK